MLPGTSERIWNQTDEQINQRIRQQTEMNLSYYSDHPDQIEQRISELDQEWDTERTLETLASSFVLGGLVLGARGGRMWKLLPFVVSGFLLQHAVQGWCPPLAVIRRLGVRTQREIDTERFGLKILRGDLDRAGEEGRKEASRIMEVVGH